MTATAIEPLVDRVLSATPAEKQLILESLLREWATSPNAVPPLPHPTNNNGIPVRKVYTPEEVEELRRRLANLDDSIEMQEFIDQL